MSHHITLHSLIVDFKRSNEGSNIATSSLLTILAPIVAAYVPPLPAGATFEGEATYNAVAKPYVNSILSDVGELVIYDTQNSEAIARAVYINRYNAAFAGELALETGSVRDIIKAIAGDVVETENIMLWYERFFNVFKNYYVELNSPKGE